MGKTLFWTLHPFLGGEMILAAVDEGLCYLGPREGNDHFSHWLKRHFARYHLVRTDEPFQECMAWLNGYWQGSRQSFPGRFLLKGTSFQCEIWRALRKIPYGQTVSYSQLAKEVGRPTAVRAVAAAVGANPLLLIIPCHRVIGKDGSLRGFRGGLEMKRKLLRVEGLRDANDWL